MRTKALLLGAALIAAGVASSMAQSNVFSVNVVGYINVPLTNGYNMVGNPLDLDGTGTNNSLNTVYNTLPDGTAAYKFTTGVGFGGASFSFGGSWFPNVSLNPGEGCFMQLPSASTATIVGNVLQGTRSTSYGTGYSILSSKFPLAGGLGTSLGFTTANDGDAVYTWSKSSQSYSGASFSFGGSWFPEPQIALGDAFFINSVGPKNWTTTFNVQ